MNNITQKLRTFTITGLLICFTGVSQTSHATIGLPDSPLFLGTSVQPNIFFALDDSGSMDFEITVAGTVGGTIHMSLGDDYFGFGYFHTEPVPDRLFNQPIEFPFSNFGPSIVPNPAWLAANGQPASFVNEAKRAWTSDYNRTFYNPNVTYDPWVGEDNAGNAYINSIPTAARIDPYDPSEGTQDLTVDYASYAFNTTFFPVAFPIAGDSDGFYPARHYVWTDDGDTVVEINGEDTFTLVEIKSGNAPFTGGASRTDCAAVPSCTFEEEIQNFANWFTYFRKREYVMKRAISELIDDSVSNMGLATMHDNNSVGTPVTDMTTQANKDTLLDELFQVDSNGGTPLRALLLNTGRYFHDQDGGLDYSALGFNDNNDNSPILSAALGGECQQNFAVVLTDGFWNGSSPSVGNTDQDGTSSFDGGPHADTYSNTLADVAMKYFEEDLSSLADNVKEVEYTENGNTYKDDNPQQHLTTYGVSFGLSGTGLITPANHDSGTAAPPWTDPISNSNEERLDDLQHAAFNGRGLFLNASDPDELIDSLSDALADIDQRTSVSGSAIAINSTVLKTTSRIFQASFNSADWTGELTAFSLNADGTINAEVWTATKNLPTVNSFTDRDHIFTSVSTGGIEFVDTPVNALLETAVGTLLVGGTTYSASELIQYIRGDQSNELVATDPLREREEILGDIVSSSPISIGDQDLGYDLLDGDEGTSYGTFLVDKKEIFTVGAGTTGDPQTAVYVGANDGMFHAFHDSTTTNTDGNELFAYIPSSLLGKLKDLADPAYGHKFYVNGGHSVGDACIGSGTCTWKSILVGTLGEGGRTVFALDVTDPFNFTAADVLWEYNFDDARPGTAKSGEMGFIKGPPQVVRLNNGKWGVVFGNGYNSDSETARLFILDAEDGTEIAVIDTNIGDSSNENGLATPLIVDTDGDRIADTIYAGDLFGNLFKFDISDGTASNWGSAFSKKVKGKDVIEPLYLALDGNGDPQPITTRPTIVNNPEGGFNIIFGTGKYIETSDTVVGSPYQIQTMYSIWDDGAAVTDRTDLIEQKITEEILFPGTTILVRVISTNDVDYTGGSPDKGWFMDALLTGATPTGERIIADPLARFGRAIFTTFIPPDSPCEPGGESVLMEIDALSGARLEDSVFDINGDGIIDDQDYVTDQYGNKVPVSGIYVPGTLTSPAVISLSDPDQEAKQLSGIDSETTTILESTGGTTVGRQSWRQLR